MRQRPRTRRRAVAAALATSLGAAMFVSPSSVAATRPGLSVITEPAAGMGFVARAVESARHLVLLEVYELEDPAVVAALVARARSHVTVEVLLDKDYHAGTVNSRAFATLRAGHVAVRWTAASYIFHEKALVIDGTTAWVGTGNLTSRYYATTRDFWVVDSIGADATAITAGFRADWRGRAPSPAPRGADLVWSPGAEATVVGLIDSARHTVSLETEELAADPVVNALVAAAHRHVAVRVTMTYSSSWRWAFNELVAAGAQVHVDHGESPIYIHAKALCIDCVLGSHGAGTVLVGSHNLSTYSLTRNRELSIRTTAPSVVQPIAAVLRSDFLAASRYSG